MLLTHLTNASQIKIASYYLNLKLFLWISQKLFPLLSKGDYLYWSRMFSLMEDFFKSRFLHFIFRRILFWISSIWEIFFCDCLLAMHFLLLLVCMDMKYLGLFFLTKLFFMKCAQWLDFEAWNSWNKSK